MPQRYIPGDTETMAAIDEFSAALVEMFPGVAPEKSVRLRSAMATMLGIMWRSQSESILPFAARVHALDLKLAEIGDRHNDSRVLLSDLMDRVSALESDVARLLSLSESANSSTEGDEIG